MASDNRVLATSTFLMLHVIKCNKRSANNSAFDIRDFFTRLLALALVYYSEGAATQLLEDLVVCVDWSTFDLRIRCKCVFTRNGITHTPMGCPWEGQTTS